MFRLHELLDRYEREVKIRDEWDRAQPSRRDMVDYSNEALQRTRVEIENDILKAFQRAKP